MCDSYITISLLLFQQQFLVYLSVVIKIVKNITDTSFCLCISSTSQSTSGSAQVGLPLQGVRLLRPPTVPQSTSDACNFPQTASPLEQNFMMEDISTPKVGPRECMRVCFCLPLCFHVMSNSHLFLSIS